MTTTNETSTELIPLDDITPATLFDPKTGTMDKILADLEKAALAEVMDGETEKGRKRCWAQRNKVAAVAKFIDEAKKSETKDLKAKAASIDREGKRAADKCEELKAKIMAPRLAWEKKEAERQQGHRQAIEYIKELGAPVDPLLSKKQKLEYYKENLKKLDKVSIDTSFEEFTDEAKAAFNSTQGHLESCFVSTEEEIKRDEELEELRAEKAKRDKEAEEERLRKEGEERAAAKLKAEQERKEAEAHSVTPNVPDVTPNVPDVTPNVAPPPCFVPHDSPAEPAQTSQEAVSPPVTTSAKGVTHRAILNALMQHSDLTEAQAKKVVILMALGKLPKVAIQY